jgi:N-succinyldiaminopimelate aminotransferase
MIPDRHGRTEPGAYNPASLTSSLATLNPQLARLQPYPFEQLRALFAGVTPDAARRPINLSIGEPKHATPQLILDALAAGAKGLANYPTTAGTLELREAIAAWLVRRHALGSLDPVTQVLPVLGSREALFSFAQSLIDRSRIGATVVMPNPFYQIYEGAALLAGATPYYVNSLAANGYAPRWQEVPDEVWRRTQLIYVCSPDNPTGRVMRLADWQLLFELSDRHDFVVAADECYSEVYFDETNPPLGSLAAAQALGRSGYPRLVSFGSLSKRSNAPGLRSGYVAGDAALIKAFLLYRTYHGSAMSPAVAAASVAAWRDEAHVRANRAKYAQKFTQLAPRVHAAYAAPVPDAAFYLWARVGGDEVALARDLYAEEAVAVLPGRYLAREADGVNPGSGYVRIALVAELDECAEAVDRLVRFARNRQPA